MTAQPLIDFTELVSAVPGEGLQGLTRQLGQRKGLSPVWCGRGPDGGRDLTFTEILSGSLSKEKTTWLVSCKDKAKSGDSVGEKDLPPPGIKDKLAQHKANGFLLVTTTTVSSSAKALLDSFDKSNGGDYHILVWDSAELTPMLMDPANHDLLKQFLPLSYQRLKGLTSLEGAILAFREQLPEQVLAEIMRLVKPYSTFSLKGSVIWPYDSLSAEAIDQIIFHLLIKRNLDEAVAATEDIDFDAFMALARVLREQYPDECFEYLSAVTCQHHDPDVRFNTVQFLFDHYEISPCDYIRFVTHLDPEGLAELYSAEIAAFVEEELLSNTSQYVAHQSLDEMSSATLIEGVQVTHLKVEAMEDKRVAFSGNWQCYVTLVFDREPGESRSIPGTFVGFFDESGMHLEEASADTSSFYQ